MIGHSMNMIQAAVHHLNAGQVPVIAVDQPLYAIAKQIQWTWPDSHGESNFVIMFGGLHIEMTILKVYVIIVMVLCFLIVPHDLTYMFISGFLLQLLGEWLEESGWTKALVQASIATTGTAESFIKVSHVTKTRHTHQITAASLWNLLQQAYDQSDLHTTMSLDEWCHQQAQSSVHFDYWLKTLSLQINMLLFVKSLREANFELYIQILAQFLPWMFALDHIHYARWLTVHVKDMALLSETHPALYAEFNDGKFVEQKSSSHFSPITIDQCHEQNNSIIKGSGGAVGLLESPSAF